MQLLWYKRKPFSTNATTTVAKRTSLLYEPCSILTTLGT